MHLCLEIQGTRVNYKIVLSLYRYVNIIKYFDRLNFLKINQIIICIYVQKGYKAASVSCSSYPLPWKHDGKLANLTEINAIRLCILKFVTYVL